MTLPTWFEGIRIERGELSDLPLPLTPAIQEEAPYASVFKVISQGVTHFVLANNVGISEDDKPYFEDSPMLEDFDFNALTARLRE